MLKSITLTADGSGNVVVAGGFEGSIELGGVILTGAGRGPHHFLAKFSPSGALLWSNVLEALAPGALGPSDAVQPAEPTLCGRRTAPAAAHDGAFTWMQGQGLSQPGTASPPPAVGGRYAEPAPDSDGEVVEPAGEIAPAAVVAPPSLPPAPIDEGQEPSSSRDSFEPVWVAQPEAAVDESAAPAELQPWQTRLRRGLGYSLGFAGTATAAGVLALTALSAPEALAPAALPAAVGSLEAGRVAATVALPTAVAAPHADPGTTGATGTRHPTTDAEVQALLAALPADVVPQGSPAELRAKAVELLETGQYERALSWSHALVAADPHHALSYLFVGAALLDLGRAAEAQQAFSECVRLATTGDVSECVALGGRR